MTRILVSVSIAVMAGYALHALAQVRADPRSVTAIASSSSEGVSSVWFFDPADRFGIRLPNRSRGSERGVQTEGGVAL